MIIATLPFFLPQMPLAGVDPVSWIIIAVYVVAAAVAVSGYAQAKKAAQAAMQKKRGILYQVRATALPRRIVYGTHRVGGIEAYVASSTPWSPGFTGNPVTINWLGDPITFPAFESPLANYLLHYVLIWSDGPCKGVKTLLFDGVEVPLVSDDGLGFVWRPVVGNKWHGYVRLESRNGDHDDALGIGVIPGWSINDKLLGICYSWVELLYNEEVFKNGVPNISVVLEGRNDVYDLRDDTEKFSANPALCQNHYMQQPWPIGPALPDAEVGEDELIAAANVCDEEVAPTDEDTSGGTVYIPRYTFNGVIELDQSTEDILQEFITSMAGTRVYVGGKWRIYAGAYITPTYVVDKDIIIGPVNRNTRSTKRDRFNTIRGVYSGSKTNWQASDFPAYTVQEFVDDDKEPLFEDIDLLNTDNVPTCRRLARIFLYRSRFARQVSVPTNVEGMRAQPGKPVIFDFPELGFNMTPMDVVGYDFSIEGLEVKLLLNLRETHPSIYDWTAEPPEAEVPPIAGPIQPLPYSPGSPVQPVTNYTDLIPPYIGGNIATFHREHGGAATKIGFITFLMFNHVPQKRWLKRTSSGTVTIQAGNGSVPTTQQQTRHGNMEYDAVSGILNAAPGSGGTVSWPVWGCSGSPPPPAMDPGLGGGPDGSGGPIITRGETTYSQHFPNDYMIGWGGCDAGAATSWGRANGGFEWQLTNEDTPENAIMRLFNSISPIESYGWVACVASPCGLSQRGRFTEFPSAFVYRGQVKHNGSGFKASTSFILVQPFIRTDLDSLASDTYETEYSVTSDGAGAFELIITIAEEEGFKIQADLANIKIIDATPSGDPDPIGD